MIITTSFYKGKLETDNVIFASSKYDKRRNSNPKFMNIAAKQLMREACRKRKLPLSSVTEQTDRLGNIAYIINVA